MELRLSEEGGACLRSNSEASEDLGLELGSSGCLQEVVALASPRTLGTEVGQGLWRGPPLKHSELPGSRQARSGLQ